MDRREALLREAAALRALLEPAAGGSVLQLYAPVQPLYADARDAPGVAQAHAEHARRGAAVRDAIARRVAARHRACVERAARFAAQRAVWQRAADAAERSSPSDGRHGMANAPATPGPAAFQMRTTRRGEVARSDVIGPPHDAPAPESRWLETRARVPPMLVADPRAAAWTAGRVLPGVALPGARRGTAERAGPAARVIPADMALHPKWHVDGPGGAGAQWAAALAAQCPPGASARPEDRTVVVAAGAAGPVVWSVAEVRVFVDMYLAYPKDFARIASALPFKRVPDVVALYYVAKHRLGLKRATRRTPHVPGLTAHTGAAQRAPADIPEHATASAEDVRMSDAASPVDGPANGHVDAAGVGSGDVPIDEAMDDLGEDSSKTEAAAPEERNIERLHALLVAGSEERIDGAAA